MKHLYKAFPFFFALVLSFSSKAQNYTISPSNTVNVTAAYNDLNVFDIYMSNTASSRISLSWTLVSNNLVQGWDYSICDLGTCYPGIPASATMDSVDAGGMGFLGLNVNPYAIPGTGSVIIYVYETQFPNNGDTLTWNVTSSPTAITEHDNALRVNAYPNPAADHINIELGGYTSEAEYVSIYNITGEKMMSVQVNGASMKMELTALAKGIYILAIENANGKVIAAKKISRN